MATVIGGAGILISKVNHLLAFSARWEKTLKNFGERIGGHDTAIAVLNDFRDRFEQPQQRRRMTVPNPFEEEPPST